MRPLNTSGVKQFESKDTSSLSTFSKIRVEVCTLKEGRRMAPRKLIPRPIPS